MKPRAVLFDLDDTILAAYGRPEIAWQVIAAEFASQLAPLEPMLAADAISGTGRAFWSDPDRHRIWRMRISDARRHIVSAAFEELSRKGHQLPGSNIAAELADRFSSYRDEQMSLFPEALAVLDALRQRGLRLALVTNGATAAQRAKITRFDLTTRFDHIQIEEETGFGKPDERAYRHAMKCLGVAADETWMVGDNLEWEVSAPQRLGIFAVWLDVEGHGVRAASHVKPDLIVRALPDLLLHLL